MTHAAPTDLTSVGYVVTHFPRVTQTFIAAEIDELRARGVDVLVASMNSPTPADAGHPDVGSTLYLKSQGVVATARALLHALRTSPTGFASTLIRAVRSARTDLAGAARRSAHFAEAMVLWSAATTRGVGHLHAHFGQSPSAVAWLAAEFARKAGTGPQTWTFTVHCASEIHDRRDAIPETKVASANAVLAVTDHTRSQIQWHLDPDLWPKVHVVRVGVDLARLPFEPQPVRHDPPRLVVVGRLAPAKGHLVLVDALGRLHARGVDVAVDIIGAGETEVHIRHRAEELGIGHLVDLHGEVPPAEVAAHLRDADAFCLPSFDEGLPVAIMEAMAMGVPVVTTYVAGIPELARDERTALVVPAANSHELAEAIGRILSDEALRQRLAADARKAVELSHDDTETLDLFVRTLEQA